MKGFQPTAKIVFGKLVENFFSAITINNLRVTLSVSLIVVQEFHSG